MDGITRFGATTSGQGGPGSDGNEGVLRIPQSSCIYEVLTIGLFSVISRTLIEGVLPPCGVVVGVFYGSGRLGLIVCLYTGMVTNDKSLWTLTASSNY